MLSRKKHVGIENLIKKGKKTWFSRQKKLNKSKEKAIATYLKLVDYLVILFVCECWSNSIKKRFLQTKLSNSLSTRKKILGIKKVYHQY